MLGLGETSTWALGVSVRELVGDVEPPPPPPQAAVSNGAMKTITAVVAFKRRCQFKLDFN